MSAVEQTYSIAIHVDNECLSPGETLRGRVVVEVPSRAGLYFRRIHLSLDGVERNSVRDDQGEFDSLLEGLTSDRRYLCRHVTLAGNAYAEEDAETAAQRRSEMQYRTHRIPPYVCVVPAARARYRDKGVRAAIALLPPMAEPDTALRPGGDGDGDDSGAVWHFLECGEHTYPFFFRLPPWLPPSLYYEVPSASGSITYSATAALDALASDTVAVEEAVRAHFVRRVEATAPFTVLSAIPAKQLLASQDEAVHHAAGLSAPLPPLSATHQVFSCSCMGNLCGLLGSSLIDVEVALQSARSLVLSDRRHVVAGLLQAHDPAASLSSAAAGTAARSLQYGSYDAFAHRGPQRRPPPAPAPALPGDKRGASPSSASHSSEGAAEAEAEAEALAEHVRGVARLLPPPVGHLPLVVRVHNNCQRTVIDCVRVELRESVHLFKALDRPHLLPAPLCRYDYGEAIHPGEEVIFHVALALPTQFRRCRADGPSLLPPPGVRTTNFRIFTNICVSFPGVPSCVLEEDWPAAVVQLAEVVDPNDEVMTLPTRFS